MGGKPKEFGPREDTMHMLGLAKELIIDHDPKDDNLAVVLKLLKILITRLKDFPEGCEFRDGCIEVWEGNDDPEPYNWRDDVD